MRNAIVSRASQHRRGAAFPDRRRGFPSPEQGPRAARGRHPAKAGLAGDPAHTRDILDAYRTRLAHATAAERKAIMRALCPREGVHGLAPPGRPGRDRGDRPRARRAPAGRTRARRGHDFRRRHGPAGRARDGGRLRASAPDAFRKKAGKTAVRRPYPGFRSYLRLATRELEIRLAAIGPGVGDRTPGRPARRTGRGPVLRSGRCVPRASPASGSSSSSSTSR